jgi:hypothetical protein
VKRTARTLGLRRRARTARRCRLRRLDWRHVRVPSWVRAGRPRVLPQSGSLLVRCRSFAGGVAVEGRRLRRTTRYRCGVSVAHRTAADAAVTWLLCCDCGLCAGSHGTATSGALAADQGRSTTHGGAGVLSFVCARALSHVRVRVRVRPTCVTSPCLPSRWL